MNAFVATKIKVCNFHDLDEKEKKSILLARSKENVREKSDFQGCYIKFIASFHLYLLSSVLWHGSSPLSNDFQENIPKKNLNPVTFPVIWSCIIYSILRTVTALKISSNCLDYKRHVFYSSFLFACRVDFFCITKWHGPYTHDNKNESESSLLLWNVDCVMISVAD